MEDNTAVKRDPGGTLKWILIAILILALGAAVWFSFNHYLSLHKARIALYEAKTACLATNAVSVEYAALGKRFSDVARESGFTEQAEADIVALGQLEGTIMLLQTEKNGYGFVVLTYEKNGYLVAYRQQDGTEKWQVYQKTALITA